MKEIWFIRHAESESNAGLPSQSPASIPITERGHLQAEHIAKTIPSKPDLIITSPYIRTRETAAPTLQKYPDSQHEVWPVQEYTYLRQQDYANTTSIDRYPKSRDYWKRADPNLILGTGAESFLQMIERVENTFLMLAENDHNFIICFSHGWYMRAMVWKLINSSELPTPHRKNYLKILLSQTKSRGWNKIRYAFLSSLSPKKIMPSFLLFSSLTRIPNTSILKFQIRSNGKIELTEFLYDHIPQNLSGKRLSNW